MSGLVVVSWCVYARWNQQFYSIIAVFTHFHLVPVVLRDLFKPFCCAVWMVHRHAAQRNVLCQLPKMWELNKWSFIGFCSDHWLLRGLSLGKRCWRASYCCPHTCLSTRNSDFGFFNQGGTSLWCWELILWRGCSLPPFHFMSHFCPFFFF